MHREGRRNRPFRVLYRVFLLRVVDLELLSADAGPTKLVGQFATIFSSISFLFALPVLLFGGGRMTMTQAWTMEHLFIETTMTVAGLITVLNWDSAFPDRRDVLVLAPLPVRASTLFLAKIAALCAAPFLAIVALNIFSGLVWPLFFNSGKGRVFPLLRVLPVILDHYLDSRRLHRLRLSRRARVSRQLASAPAIFTCVRIFPGRRIVSPAPRLFPRALTGITRSPHRT